MNANRPVTVRAVAFLQMYCREHGMPAAWQISVPDDGISALELARSIGLPVPSIEGIFHNFSISGLDTRVMPGDRVAFIPPGTPASHPAFFGSFVTH